jgi:phosphomannomutase
MSCKKTGNRRRKPQRKSFSRADLKRAIRAAADVALPIERIDVSRTTGDFSIVVRTSGTEPIAPVAE